MSTRYGPLADVLLALGAGLVLWLGVTRRIDGRMTVGVLLVVLSYLAGLYGPIRVLTGLSSTFAKGAASRERIEDVMNSHERVAERAGARPLVAVEQQIALWDVHFAYRADTPVLRGVDLVLPAGATLCLLGRNGAGKSTLINLLLRFYDPDRGAAIEITAATFVTCSGQLLSGGQRRRLAIARALIRRAPILLLDEPTSGLDTESGEAVLAAIRSAAEGWTVIVVTHGPDLAQTADIVAVLAEGRIASERRGTAPALALIPRAKEVIGHVPTRL